MKPYLIPVPDTSLWRIVYANGAVSDMLNLTRAKDTLAKITEQKAS